MFNVNSTIRWLICWTPILAQCVLAKRKLMEILIIFIKLYSLKFDFLLAFYNKSIFT